MSYYCGIDSVDVYNCIRSRLDKKIKSLKSCPKNPKFVVVQSCRTSSSDLFGFEIVYDVIASTQSEKADYRVYVKRDSVRIFDFQSEKEEYYGY